jgi:putative nucleotidyltransferase with HDIG domain
MRPSSFDKFRKPPSGLTPRPTSGVSAAVVPPQVSLVAKERRAQAILASLDNLPTLPSVAMEVLRLARNPNAQASDFEEILRRDQALTARVLRLVNSPFFGLRSRVTSIPHAIVVLGLRTLRSVVVAAQTSRLLDRQLGPYGLADGGMWKHSMSCATLTGMLAERLRMSPEAREEIFVGGLLHDVGKIILAPHVAGVQAEFDRAVAQTGDVVRAEIDAFGMSHPEVGGKMGRRWGLSASLVELLEEHHRPLASAGGRANAGLLVVQVANDLCHQLGVGRKAGPAAPSVEFGPRLAALGVAGEQTTLLEAARKTIAGLEHVLHEIGQP